MGTLRNILKPYERTLAQLSRPLFEWALQLSDSQDSAVGTDILDIYGASKATEAETVKKVNALEGLLWTQIDRLTFFKDLKSDILSEILLASPEVKIDSSPRFHDTDFTGNIFLKETTNTFQEGILYKPLLGVIYPFLHDFTYGDNGVAYPFGLNVFLGTGAGNLTLGATATNDWESSFNAVVGAWGLSNLTKGYNNAGIGYSVFLSLTEGYKNSAVGEDALGGLTTGYSDVGLGELAGAYYDSGGGGINSTGNKSVFLGAETKAYANADTNEIVIGYQAIGKGSNTATLGNDSITDTYLKGNALIQTTKYVGLGAAAGRIVFTDAATDTVVFSDCNVGIGGTPTSRLTVVNAGAVAINLNDSSNTAIPTFNFQQVGATKAAIEGGTALQKRLDFKAGLVVSRVMNIGQNFAYGVIIGRGYISTIGTIAPTDGLLIEGNLGVGIDSPVAKVHIDQSSLTGAVPPLLLDQADVSEEFIKLIGTSAAAATNSLARTIDLPTPGAFIGWEKVYIQDDSVDANAIADGVYWTPIFGPPTAGIGQWSIPCGITLAGNLIVPDGGTIGQAAGPFLTFNDTGNILKVSGCTIGLLTSYTPGVRSMGGFFTTFPNEVMTLNGIGAASEFGCGGLRVARAGTWATAIDYEVLQYTMPQTFRNAVANWIGWDIRAVSEAGATTNVDLNFYRTHSSVRGEAEDSLGDVKDLVLVLDGNSRVGIGRIPTAQLDVYQKSATGATPVLTLEQLDVSEELIRLIGTSAADNSQSLVDAADLTTPGAFAGAIRVYVNDQRVGGLSPGIYWLNLHTTPTA